MAINIKPGERILIVAPHPDDESIGCGGLICLYHDQVDVLLVTDGFIPERQNTDVAETRKNEFLTAMQQAGVHKSILLHIPEHAIRASRKQFRNVDFSIYSHVFVPNRYEIHKDHTDVYKVVRKMIRRKTKLYEYEVWTTIRRPNIIVDIGSVTDDKRSLIGCHRSQLRELDYEALALGLNAYRGRVHNMQYAEAYYCRQEIKDQRIRRIKRTIKHLISKRKE